MMKLFAKIIVLAAFALIPDVAQALNFKPLLANTFEPRVGTIYECAGRKLRLDICTSLDVKTFDLQNSKLSIGVDFFTYTRLRSEGKFKFPVETADYFFGVNGAYVSNPWSFRFRVAHISSHIVDGMADSVTLKREPFVYSREFFDLVGAYQWKNLRFYAGATLLFSMLPKDFLAVQPQVGLDYRYPLTSVIDIVAGYDLKFAGMNSNYYPVHSMQAGLNFKTSEDVGIFFGAYGFHGKSIHGMFYNEVDDYLGVGFQVMF